MTSTRCMHPNLRVEYLSKFSSSLPLVKLASSSIIDCASASISNILSRVQLRQREMSSLQRFCVEFDRPNAIYAPGEAVTGNIVINLIKQKVVRALNLSAKGQAHVKWTENVSERDSNGNTNLRTVYYTGKELYFHVTYSILEKSKDDGMVYIPAGLSRYSFRIQIPHNIPCSFEHTYGYIRYTIKGIIDRPWKFDHECKAAFTVISIYDLNLRRERCMSLHDEQYKNFYSLCCFKGSINVQITMPKTGFVPGQYIEATLNLSNTSNINVEKISAKLERSLEFHSKKDFHIETFKKKDKLTVAEMQTVGPFDRNAVINVRVYVPSVPPSDLEFCNIIHLRYSLHIILHVSGFHLNFSKKYPILIGTLPLRPDPSAPMIPSLIPSSFQSSILENEIAPTPLGFVARPNAPSDTILMNNYFDAPPSYEESCTSKAYSIREHGESEYMYGANESFAPKYPVFSFSTSHAS